MSLIDRLRPQVREPRLHLRDDFWRRKHRKPQPPLSIVPNDEPMDSTAQFQDHERTKSAEEMFERLRAASTSIPSDQKRNRLDEIAAIVRALTYGEMMELAEAIWGKRPEGGELTQEALPMTLHLWSQKQK